MEILFNWIPAFAGTTNKTDTIRPPWMVEVQITQEQLFACRSWMVEVQITQEPDFDGLPLLNRRKPNKHVVLESKAGL